MGGFFAAGDLKKVRVTSPIVQVIASPGIDDGRRGMEPERRHRVSRPWRLTPRLGERRPDVSRFRATRTFHLWPQFLDDGEHYIYSSFTPRRLLLGSLTGAPPRTLMTFP